MTREKILKEGAINNECPKITLKKLFDSESFLDDKGCAFISVEYYGYCDKNQFTRVSGCNHVSEDILKTHDYTVHRQCDDSIHIKLLDYCNFFWYSDIEKGKLNMHNKEVHDKQILMMNDYIKETGKTLP